MRKPSYGQSMASIFEEYEKEIQQIMDASKKDKKNCDCIHCKNMKKEGIYYV